MELSYSRQHALALASLSSRQTVGALLAKHSKSFSLVDATAVGVDRMQRSFEPMRQQVETWRQAELSNVTARMIIYQAFHRGRVGRTEAPGAARSRLILRTVARRFQTENRLSNGFTSAFKELDPVPQFKATAKLGGVLEAWLKQSFRSKEAG